MSRRTKKVGGTLYAFPANAMDIGMGLSDINGYLGYYPFANILLSGGNWEQTSGSGGWSANLSGELTASVGTDRFRSIIIEGIYNESPHGTYTVLNPNGCKIGFGSYSLQEYAAFTTATSFTFNYTGAGMLALHAEGSCSGVKVIIPGHLTSFNAGNPWNNDFLTFQNGLKSKAYRFMDWLQGYKDIATDWADIPTSIPMISRCQTSQLRPRIHYDLLIDLCNRTNKHFYVNIPVRVTDAFVLALAQKIQAQLNPGLSVFIEYGNEVWNPGGPYYEARSWVEHINNTSYEAVPNFGINGFTRTAHGLTNGAQICDYMHKDNFVSNPSQTYPLGYGIPWYVEVVDANNFRILQTYPGGTINPPQTGMTKLLYKKHVPDGGQVNVDANYGIRSKQIWDIFDSVLGRSRCVHLLGTQLVNPAVTDGRITQTGVLAATDAVATAFYNSCDWWLAALDIASTQVTPKAWASLDEGEIRIAIYANGSPTPSSAQIDAGSGTGFVAARTIAMTQNDQPAWVTASAVTGLVNGTTYRAEIIYTGENGVRWRAVQSFTVSATPSTVIINDSADNIAQRHMYGTAKWMVYVAGQVTAARGKPLVNYEIGPDTFFNNNQMAEVKASRAAWYQTSQAGDMFRDLYRTLAANGYRFSAQFTDVNANQQGVFSLADGLTDTSDPRYLAVAGFNGQVPYQAPLAISSPVVAPDIPTEPSYPYTIYTFPSGQTPSLYGGNLDGNYAVVGREVRLISGAGIDWGAPQGRSIKLAVSDGNTRAYPTLTFSTGNAWYEADALFAWDSIADSDPAEINPVIGNTMALNGTAATVASGLWDLGGNGAYYSATALTSAVDTSKPLLIAAVLDKDNQSVAGSNILKLSGSFAYAFAWWGGGTPFQLNFNRDSGGTHNPGFAAGGASAPTGKHVFWIYHDGTTLRIGIDQTEYTAGAGTIAFPSSVSRNLGFGSNLGSGTQSNMKHGSAQVVNRAGMTLANALAMVAKMQTHHGIP